MSISFIRFFLSHLLSSRSRQKIVLLALFGLLLSSFSLLFLQGIMGGLQENMIQRSKDIHGDFLLRLDQDLSQSERKQLVQELSDYAEFVTQELEVELLVRHRNYLSPVLLRGLLLNDDQIPAFLKGYDLSGLILGSDLARKIRAYQLAEVVMYSPAAVNEMLGDVPRVSSDEVSDLFHSGQIEVDGIQAWTRIEFVQNLLAETKVNSIRLYQATLNVSQLNNIVKRQGLVSKVKLYSWADLFPELMWAFQLENIVMILLFTSMCLLISLSIVSGFSLFFNKIKFDLATLWFLGCSRKKLNVLCLSTIQVLNLIVCSMGVALALLILKLLKYFNPTVMPDVFMERSLPVSYSWWELLLSLGLPYMIATIFSILSYRQFFQENKSFLPLIRRLGQ